MKSHHSHPRSLRSILCVVLCACCLLGLALPAQAQNLDTYEQELLDLINAERTRQGSVALEVDPLLQQCARIRAQESVERFSHKRPDTTAWSTVFEQVGVEAVLHSENLANEQETPKNAFDGWMKSKSHRENMLNPEYTRVGLASAVDDKGMPYYCLLLIIPE